MLKKILFLFFSLALFLNPIFANDLDKKIGQMLIIGFEGNKINSSSFKKIQKQIKKGEISGVILFSKNIKSKDDLSKMNEILLKSNNIIPFISIDNEGGQIQRFDFYNNKSAKEISNLENIDARQEYSSMAKNLKSLNFNLNFAPCVDLEINPDSIISKKERSYSKDPNIVSNYSKIFIEEHSKEKIATSIKHFPGHGNVSGDTHLGFVDSTNTFNEIELEPYKNLVQYDKTNKVMIFHIFNKNFDEKYPASLSKKTVDFLKNNIGFKGLIVSDDYDMRSIRDNYKLDEIIVNSINSGINLLIFSNNIKVKEKNLAKKFHKIIKKELKKGTIKKENIENSYQKIIQLKNSLL